MRPEKDDFRAEKANLRPEKVDLRPERSYFKPERTDLRSRMAWGDTRRKMDNGKLKMEKQNCSMWYQKSLAPSRMCPKTGVSDPKSY